VFSKLPPDVSCCAARMPPVESKKDSIDEREPIESLTRGERVRVCGSAARRQKYSRDGRAGGVRGARSAGASLILAPKGSGATGATDLHAGEPSLLECCLRDLRKRGRCHARRLLVVLCGRPRRPGRDDRIQPRAQARGRAAYRARRKG
jgi:hypothetical protein